MTSAAPKVEPPKDASRYELLAKIASGGMATVYVGRLQSAVGFWRLVAIKRAHTRFGDAAAFRKMFMEEARLASRIHHANVVSVLDVEDLKGELRLVMDYIEGASLRDLVGLDSPLPPRLAVRIALDACAGLQAAHELADDAGKALGIVHRDVSPHNLLVGLDGVSRLTDFGIAKLTGASLNTTAGSLKGKIGYMAPEYVESGELDARSDVFSLGVVLWEALANARLFTGSNEVEALKRIVSVDAPPISSVAPSLSQLDAVLAASLARNPAERFSSAGAFANALETAARRADLVATHAEVAAHVRELAGEDLAKRREQIRTRAAEVDREREGLQPTTASFAAATRPADDGNESSRVVTRPNTLELGPPSIPRARLGGVIAAAIGFVAIALVAVFAQRLLRHDDAAPATPETAAAPSSSAAASPPPAASSSAPAAPPPHAESAAPPPTVVPPPVLTGRLKKPAIAATTAPAATPADPGPTIKPNPY